ncbi:hypothetical protein ACE6H2_010256 [Prunus campanulata]
MAEAVITTLVSPVVSIALDKLSSLATAEFCAFIHVKDDIKKLESTLTDIQQLITQLISSNSPDMNWLVKLQAVAYDAEDLIDCWATEYHQWKMKKQVRKLRLPFNTSNFLFQQRQLRKLREIKAEISELLQNGQCYKTIIGNPTSTSQSSLQPQQTGSLSNNLVVSREEDKKKIIELLIPDEEASDGGNLSFVPIVGTGGLGKTTLAQLIYQDEKVENYFEIKTWVCVTNNFDMKSIFREIVVSHMSEKNIGHDVNNLSYAQLQTRVQDILTRKRFILVLDDLWNYNHVELQPLLDVLNLGGRGSKVLVTNRISDVANIKGSKAPYYLQCLDDNESWSLFAEIAFKEGSFAHSDVEELNVYGKEIVRKCSGLPLAVKQMGGLLRGKTVDEWKHIMRSEALEVKEDKIRPVLRLSYNHLPSPDHKQCFAYCSLFPKAHVYEKNELVKLWMAEAFIRPHNRQRTEDIGRAYFKELSDRFFFESLTQGKDDGKYKMHDLIHDFAQTVSSPFCCQVTDTKSLERVDKKSRHVSLLSKDVEQPTIEIISRSNKLRTLLFPVQHLRTFGKAQYEIFDSLTYMRVLDLSSSTLLKLPDSIEKLKLLHYLDLSKTEIKKLPESVCKLYNLETLKLLGCPWLLSLPKKLKNLVKLRHLELDEMFWYKASAFPQGMGCLTSLHNLHKFQVGRDTGYKLEELKKMEYLTGTLHISKLENSENAVEANLKGKEMIQKVVYEWSSNTSDVNLQDEAAAKQVLEDLQPYSSLKELQICHYRGTDFPNWMKHGQLRNLVNISLNGCTRIKILTLGELHNLVELRLKNMLELEEWQGEVFESLSTLKISNCPKLMKMPRPFLNLHVLKIKKCASLETVPFSGAMFVKLVDNPVLKHWPEVTLVSVGQWVTRHLNFSASRLLEVNIIHCPELRSLPRNVCPQKLELSGCMSLRSLPDQRCSGRLQVLALDACPDETLVSMIPGTWSLYSLAVSNISNFICLPKWPSLPGLKALYISNCGDLEYLTNQENRTLFNGFTSLQLLSIQKCPKLVTLPVEGLPTSLQVLIISSCASLESFGAPDVLKNLTSLHDLYIEDCQALQSLPGDGLPTSLQHLSIQSCPSLIAQCEKEDGDLPKIEGIADREIKPSTRTATSS